MEPLVQCKDVSRWFGHEQILRGVDLEVARGSVTALLGRNASGKSTLLRIMMGMLARDGGDARVLGRDPEELGPEERDRMALVVDTGSLVPPWRVRDEIALVREVRRARWNEERCKQLVARFEVPVDKLIRSLSKGQQARLRLVLALATEPELLLLDEPALGLDLFARQELLELIIETVEHEDRAVVIASHLIDDVDRVCDRAVFLREGRVVAQGAIDDLRDRFRRVRVRVGEGGTDRLAAAAGELIGVRRLELPAEGPPDEPVVIVDGYDESFCAQLEERAGVTRVETRRMTLREIYLEVLGPSCGKEEVRS